MCLILFSYNDHPHYRLILAANRDELYSRPADPVRPWEDYPDVLAGRDLEQGGTWLGITGEGRFAAVTNYRSPALVQAEAVSRGKLVSGYLTCSLNPNNYLKYAKKERHLYNPFNLLAGDKTSLFFYSSLGLKIEPVKPGIHGLSNHKLDTPWPKVVKGKENLRQYLQGCVKADPGALFKILADTAGAPDPSLPETGVGMERERLLSPIFIKKTDFGYGTRTSSVLLIDRLYRVLFVERTFDGSPDQLKQETAWEFDMDHPVFKYYSI